MQAWNTVPLVCSPPPLFFEFSPTLVFPPSPVREVRDWKATRETRDERERRRGRHHPPFPPVPRCYLCFGLVLGGGGKNNDSILFRFFFLEIWEILVSWIFPKGLNLKLFFFCKMTLLWKTPGDCWGKIFWLLPTTTGSSSCYCQLTPLFFLLLPCQTSFVSSSCW